MKPPAPASAGGWKRQSGGGRVGCRKRTKEISDPDLRLKINEATMNFVPLSTDRGDYAEADRLATRAAGLRP